MLTRRLWRPCCAVSSVSSTAVRTARRRAIRTVGERTSHRDNNVMDGLPDPTSLSSATSPSAASSHSSLLSPPPLTASLSPSSPSSLSSSLSSSPDVTLPTSPNFPKAVHGLTELKLQELAASMPPVLKRRENVVVLPTPPESQAKVKKSPTVTEENFEEVLAALYAPQWRTPYEQQLEEKEWRAGQCLRKLKNKMVEVCRFRLPAGLPRLPCPLHPIMRAPSEREYRSEDTFTVWRGMDGNPKTVGLLTGDTKTEGTVCLPPSSLISVKTKHKAFCQAFQDYIRGSPHPSFLDYHSSRGVWRTVCARTTDQGETMAAVSVFPHQLDEEGVANIADELREYFTTGPGASVGLSALHLQVSEMTHKCRHRAPYIPVFGPPHLLQTSAGVQCRVMPGSALPVNPAAEELLVSAVQQATNMSPDTTLLYVNAASGHISLPLAKGVRRTVCLESSSSAAEDASANIADNDIVNTTMLGGTVEKELPATLADLQSADDVVAVVHCGKGLSPQVVLQLRKTRAISQLVLLTTKPDGHVLANCASFCNDFRDTKIARYPPLLPALAFPLDIAPHTPDFLMGILLVRREGGEEVSSSAE